MQPELILEYFYGDPLYPNIEEAAAAKEWRGQQHGARPAIRGKNAH
ncbi:MAG: hypothetical protein NVS1B11_25740 [Terriglobales bacterium]